MRVYSRLNWDALKYPTSFATLSTLELLVIMRRRAATRRSCFRYCMGDIDVTDLN